MTNIGQFQNQKENQETKSHVIPEADKRLAVSSRSTTCNVKIFIHFCFYAIYIYMSNFCRAICHAQAWRMPSCGVCLSVTFVRSVEKNNISSIFFTTMQLHHSSFSTTIFQRETRYQGVECWQNSRFPTSIWLHRVLSTLRPPGVINTVPPDRGKF